MAESRKVELGALARQLFEMEDEGARIGKPEGAAEAGNAEGQGKRGS